MRKSRQRKTARMEKAKKEQAEREATLRRKLRMDVIAKVREGADIYEAARSFVGAGSDTVPDLLAILDDMNPRIQHFAILALGAVGPDAKQAIPILTGLLKQAPCRIDSAKALGMIGPAARSAIPALFVALDRDASAKPLLQTTLTQIDPEAGGDQEFLFARVSN